MLEDAGGLFDHRPMIFGFGIEDRIELTLADDDVLVAADAAIGKQLLNIEQPAVDPVDLIIAAAVAIKPAGDADLIEIQRQYPRAIVENEGDFAASQSRAGGGPGEDDVVHLFGPQRPGRLRPHHPGEGVDQIRLARAVGADHDRHTRFKLEPGAVGERLEPDHFQRFQEHESQPCYFSGPEAITAPRGRLEPYGERRKTDLGFHRGDIDGNDRGKSRPRAEPGNQAVNARLRSLGKDLNTTIRQVADPATQSVLLGFLQRRVAKPDALHSSRHRDPDGS